MQFTINRNNFLKELAPVYSIGEKKNTIPILQYLLVQAGNFIKLTGTDLDNTLVTVVDADIKQPGSMLIQARKLYDVVRSLSGDELTIRRDDQGWAVVTSQKAKFRIPGNEPDQFPSIQQFEHGTTTLSAKALRYAIEHVSFAITQDESQRYALSGAQLILNQDGGKLIATDGHRLAIIESKELWQDLAEDAKVLIPKKLLQQLAVLAGDTEEPIKFHSTPNHLYFQIEKRLLIGRQLSGQFPNYELVMPKEINHTITVDAASLLATIKRVALMADNTSKRLQFDFTPEVVTITSNSPETGEATDSVAIQYAGPEIKLGFNAQYVIDFLEHCDTKECKIEFKEIGGQGLFKPTENSKYFYQYVLMPMR